MNILLLDDDEGFTSATRELLQILGHRVTTADSVATASAVVKQQRFDHLILDLILPDGSGLHVLEAVEDSASEPRVTLITGHTSVKSIVKNLYGPNINYLIKPIDLAQLEAVLQPPVPVPSSKVPVHFGGLVGESDKMQHLYEMIDRVAVTKANVMLMGESGVGKEMVASAIHYASQPEGSFVAANCGAFPRELISSELFGHEKGAFTGASGRKTGLFEQADRGTLFLDEITEMPIDLQPHLLRALETRQITPLGSTRQVNFDCRVVSATNRSEASIAADNCLREDLYFRLAVFPIQIPPLRERREDIPLLTEYFIEDLNRQYDAEMGIDEADLDRLRRHDWPGNVRELRHAIHRAFIMADPLTHKIQLPQQLSSPFSRTENQLNPGITVGKTVDDVERELIEKTLNHFDGDKKQAADMLGISLKTLYNRLNSYAEDSAESP